MMKENCGFLELDHTADWAIKVWAPDLLSLLITAAKGMYSLSKIEISTKTNYLEAIFIESIDNESLLVDFLSELLYLGETQHIAAAGFNLNLEDHIISGELLTAKIRSWQKEIKAVTFYDLEIIQTETGFETVVVFDV